MWHKCKCIMKYISADILIHNNIFLWSKNFYVILYKKKPYFHYCIILRITQNLQWIRLLLLLTQLLDNIRYHVFKREEKREKERCVQYLMHCVRPHEYRTAGSQSVKDSTRSRYIHCYVYSLRIFCQSSAELVSSIRHSRGHVSAPWLLEIIA